MKILHLSDPHVDFTQDQGAWDLLAHFRDEVDYDLILCTGDIANNRNKTRRFLGFFEGVGVPKYLTRSNHSSWVYNDSQWEKHDADKYGWIMPDSPSTWGQYYPEDDIYLLNMWYNPLRGVSDEYNDPNYTNDSTFWRRYGTHWNHRTLPAGIDAILVAGHLSPSRLVPSQFPPRACYINEQIMDFCELSGASTYIHGHTHEPHDTQIGPLRVVNLSFVDHQYGLRRELWDSPPIIQV